MSPCALEPNSLDLVLGKPLFRSVIELCRPRTLVCRHFLSVLERSAVGEVGGDIGSPGCATANFLGFRQFPLGPGVIGGLAASTPDGIWLGTYENGPGRLFRFTAATLARLSDGETLGASQAATVLTIPDHAQGAAIGGGGLWIARSDWSWGTLDLLDPATGAPQRRYEIAPGTEGIAFGSAGRLWAVSEAGSRHIYDHPFLGLFEPFFPLVFALDLSRLE